jgi:hypothetical protein
MKLPLKQRGHPLSQRESDRRLPVGHPRMVITEALVAIKGPATFAEPMKEESQ